MLENKIDAMAKATFHVPWWSATNFVSRGENYSNKSTFFQGVLQLPDFSFTPCPMISNTTFRLKSF